jgi:3-oxoacyl-(acyl-carrier-protein) synthase
VRRAVITGLGIVSCIGNNKAEVVDSLRNCKSVSHTPKNLLRWVFAARYGVSQILI